MSDPILAQLEERRRKARRLVERGTAISDRGKAELAECDRFEQFYRNALSSAASNDLLMVPHHGARVLDEQEHPEMREIEQIARSRAQGTLKAAIVSILRNHPEGLLSGELLTQLHQNGYPDLLRTSMSPQLSRMKGFQVDNIDGRWVLKNKDAAEAKSLGGIFD